MPKQEAKEHVAIQHHTRKLKATPVNIRARASTKLLRLSSLIKLIKVEIAGRIGQLCSELLFEQVPCNLYLERVGC